MSILALPRLALCVGTLLLAACGERPAAAAAPAAAASPAAARGLVTPVPGNDRYAATMTRGALGDRQAYRPVDANGDRSFSADELEAVYRAPAAARRVAVLDARGSALTVRAWDAQAGMFRVNAADDGLRVSVAKGAGQRADWALHLLGTAPAPDAAPLVHRPADEAEARRIEAEVTAEARGSGMANLPVLYLGEVVHTRDDGLHARAVVRVDAISVLARDARTVLFTFDRRALGDKIWLEHLTVGGLGLSGQPGN